MNGKVPGFMARAAGKRPALALAGEIPDALACPSPVPTSFSWSIAKAPDGKSVVVLQIATPSGVQFSFMDGETAKHVGEALVSMGKQATSDILIVPGVNDVQ